MLEIFICYRYQQIVQKYYALSCSCNMKKKDGRETCYLSYLIKFRKNVFNLVTIYTCSTISLMPYILRFLRPNSLLSKISFCHSTVLISSLRFHCNLLYLSCFDEYKGIFLVILDRCKEISIKKEIEI